MSSLPTQPVPWRYEGRRASHGRSALTCGLTSASGRALPPRGAAPGGTRSREHSWAAWEKERVGEPGAKPLRAEAGRAEPAAVSCLRCWRKLGIKAQRRKVCALPFLCNALNQSSAALAKTQLKEDSPHLPHRSFPIQNQEPAIQPLFVASCLAHHASHLGKPYHLELTAGSSSDQPSLLAVLSLLCFCSSAPTK